MSLQILLFDNYNREGDLKLLYPIFNSNYVNNTVFNNKIYKKSNGFSFLYYCTACWGICCHC